MESIIRKIIPCRFKQSEYKCELRGLNDKQLSCEGCESYRSKNPIPKYAPILRPSDYIVIASEIV